MTKTIQQALLSFASEIGDRVREVDFGFDKSITLLKFTPTTKLGGEFIVLFRPIESTAIVTL